MVRAKALQVQETIPKWRIKCDYVETCNCDFGCPCNFSGTPTYGSCRGLIFYRITSGVFGETGLDGLSVVYAASWPKAIHKGDGTAQIYVGKEANRKQRDAITKIFYGKAKGSGPFAVFAGTLKYVLEPQFVNIKYRVNGKKTWFEVPGVLKAQLEPFKHPVTGKEAETEVHVPKGFIWKVAKACKTKVMHIVSPNLSFDDSGQNAFFCDTLTFKGP